MTEIHTLRVIEGTNTQTRNLFVVVNLIKLIGHTSTPLSILKRKAEKWSINQEIHSSIYRSRNGKLTINQKMSVKAFDSYVDLLEKMKIITRISDILRCSRLGQLYLFLASNTPKIKADQLDNWEKLFLSYILFKEDADFILSILDLVESGLSAEIKIRGKFDAYYVTRLKAKFPLLGMKDKKKYHEEILVYSQSKISKYAHKHDVPVRLEWLTQLGILTLTKKKYQLSNKGLIFYQKLSSLTDNIKDISITWLNKNCFSEIGSIYKEKEEFFNEEEYFFLLKKHILLFFKEFGNDNAYRLPIEASIIYLIIKIFSDTKEAIILDIIPIKQILKKGLDSDKFHFILKEAGRNNEGYISVQYKS